MPKHRQSLTLRSRTKKLLRAVPLFALAGGFATVFFGQGVQAAPFDLEAGDHVLAGVEDAKPMTAGPLHWEENYTNAQCASPGFVAPCDGEEKHWVATRFEPEDYPFVATKVSYTMWGNRPVAPGCDSTLAHKASVFIGNKTPRSSPTLIETIVVPYDKAAVNDRHVELSLTSGVHLSQGQFLYVSIQNEGDATPTPSNSCNGAGKFTCPSTCDHPSRGGTSFWSNANAAPFTWAKLASFNIFGDVRIGVYGYTP